MSEPRQEAITDQNYWTKRHSRLTTPSLQPAWSHEAYFSDYLPVGDTLKALEIGVFPGAALLHLALNYGYSPIGIDFTPDVHLLKRLYEEHGINGEFIEADFLDWNPNRQFEIVLSSGFIEHFEDYSTIVEKHWSLVAPGGLLIITVPYLGFYQRFLRRLCYTKKHWNYILSSHNQEAMNYKNLGHVIQSLEDADIKFGGYLGHMRIWFDWESEQIRPSTRWLKKPVRLVERVAQRLKLDNGLVSPEIGFAVSKVVHE